MSKTNFYNYRSFGAVLIFILSIYSGCVPDVYVSSSWTKQKAAVKNSPRIAVMAMGRKVENRKMAEKYLVNELVDRNFVAIGALEIFSADTVKLDSLKMVNTLHEHKIDLLLTNAVVKVTEKQRFEPGESYVVPVGYNETTYPYYGGYYGYYNSHYTYYFMPQYNVYHTQGNVVTDVEVLIESNLYDVSTGELIWVGQSTSYSAEPSPELFKEFSHAVVADIVKHKLLVK